MAEHVHTTSAPASAPPTPDSLPSIYTLGVELALARHAQHRADKARLAASGDHPRCAALDTAMNLLQERGASLCDVIATMAPVTLKDAAVQIEVAACLADDMVANKHSECELEQFNKTMLRITLGVLPVLAAAAGLDIDEMQWKGVAALHARQSAALEFLA